MSLRNGIALFVVLSTIALLVACGGSSTPTAQAPPSGGFSQSSLNGTYVFSISGLDSGGDGYAAVGAFTANGSGGITGGTIDMNDTAASGAVVNSPINNNGFYTVGADGRGQATLGVPGSFFVGAGDNGNITLDFVLQDSNHGLVTEFDENATGSGTIDLQSSGVTPAGTYAFSFSGTNSSVTPFATVGNFTIGAGGAITGLEDITSGSITYTAAGGNALTGTVVAGPSSSPGTFLTSGSNVGGGTLQFDVYPIDATDLKFIEVDTTGTLVGDAFAQTTATIATGTFSFTLYGGFDNPFAAGGFMTTNGSGGLSITEDVNQNGTPSSAPISATGSYAASGTGRYLLNGFSGFIGGSAYAAYPSSGGLLLLEVDDSGITFGAGYQQTAGATFSGSEGYGLNLSGTNVDLESEGGGPVEVDDIAEFTAASGGTLTGIIDENYQPDNTTPAYDLALSDGAWGTSTSTSSGSFSVAASAGTLAGGFILTLYPVDGVTFPFIESDTFGQISAGVIFEQNPGSTSGSAQRSKHMFAPHLLVNPNMVHRNANKKLK
jgi:hypothetical protein